MTVATTLKSLGRLNTALLTTYCSEGLKAEDVRVRIAVEDERILFGIGEDSEHVERLHHYPIVDLTPCSPRGVQAGPPIRAQVRRLEGPDSQAAARRLMRTHPFYLTVPLSHRLLRYRNQYYELRPFEDQHIESAEGAPD